MCSSDLRVTASLNRPRGSGDLRAHPRAGSAVALCGGRLGAVSGRMTSRLVTVLELCASHFPGRLGSFSVCLLINQTCKSVLSQTVGKALLSRS